MANLPGFYGVSRFSTGQNEPKLKPIRFLPAFKKNLLWCAASGQQNQSLPVKLNRVVVLLAVWLPFVTFVRREG